MNKTPINREDDGELLGFVAGSGGNWQAQTVFGYTMTRTTSKEAAEQAVREDGLKFMTGVWQYYDKDDGSWHSCIIKEANQVNVTVIRTNSMGYQDRDNYKLVTIQSPDETNLIKT